MLVLKKKTVSPEFFYHPIPMQENLASSNSELRGSLKYMYIVNIWKWLGNLVEYKKSNETK